MSLVLLQVLQEIEWAVGLDDGSTSLQYPSPTLVRFSQLYGTVVIMTIA